MADKDGSQAQTGAFLAQGFSERIGQGRQNLVGLLLEAMPLLAVATWFVARDEPSPPDRASAAAWHLMPFLAAWYGVRIWKRLGSLRQTRPASARGGITAFPRSTSHQPPRQVS